MIQIHVDVDNLWMYEQEFGIKIHSDRQYIYSHSLPVFLKLLRKYRSKATFMIIGQDLKLPACQVFCRKAVADGHEIGNHTWSHPISFGTMSFEQKRQQISRTHELITQACGKTPVGFRGSGYYQDEEIISILIKLNYQYDSSVLPGFSQLLMSTYALFKGGEHHYKTFGRPSYLTSREHPYVIKSANQDQKLLELPISVLPLFRLPIHTTFAYFFGPVYRQLILNHLKAKRNYMLYLFHAIDFVDLPNDRNHPIIPLRYTLEERMNFIQNILKILVEANGEGLRTTRNHLSHLI